LAPIPPSLLVQKSGDAGRLLLDGDWSLHSVASHWLRNGVDGSQCELRAFLNEHARRQIADQSHKRDAGQEREA